MRPLVPVLRAPALEAVRHGFTTREGGISPPPRRGLHLAVKGPEQRDEVVENWRRLAASVGFDPSRLALVDQVHGADVLVAERGLGAASTLGPADGLVTCRPGLVVAVRTADCVPVLFSAPNAVGAAHAGWRGLVAGVLPATAARLCELAGCEPADLVAAIGPCAGVDAYETGPGVPDALAAAGLDRGRVAGVAPSGREHTDLRAAAELQLRAAGIDRIDHVDVCTLSDPRMYSHRRDGPHTGRLAAFIVCPH